MFDVKTAWLPLGSIVQLHEVDHPVMVCAFMASEASDGQIFDYGGCAFPEGMQGMGNVFFDKDQIEAVHAFGLVNASSIAFGEYLESLDEEYQEARYAHGAKNPANNSSQELVSDETAHAHVA